MTRSKLLLMSDTLSNDFVTTIIIILSVQKDGLHATALDQFGACFTRAIGRAGLWGVVGLSRSRITVLRYYHFFEFEPPPPAYPLTCLLKPPITPSLSSALYQLFCFSKTSRGNGKGIGAGTKQGSPPLTRPRRST